METAGSCALQLCMASGPAVQASLGMKAVIQQLSRPNGYKHEDRAGGTFRDPAVLMLKHLTNHVGKSIFRRLKPPEVALRSPQLLNLHLYLLRDPFPEIRVLKGFMPRCWHWFPVSAFLTLRSPHQFPFLVHEAMPSATQSRSTVQTQSSICDLL